MQNHRFLDTGPQLSVSCLQKLFGFFFFFYALAVNISASSIQPEKSTENCQYLGMYFKKFRLEGEPVVLNSPFPKLGNRVLFTLHSNLSWHKNDSEKTVLGTHKSGRTWMKDNALWILPATPEDTGTYICTFRNESYCATMSVELKVFKKSEASLQNLSYQQVLITSSAGYLVCPDIDDFIQDKNNMEIKWYKEIYDASPEIMQIEYAGLDQHQERDDALVTQQNETTDAVLLDQSNKMFSILKGSVSCHINNVSLDSSGYYTCELPFVYEGVTYNITRHINPRIIKKKVETMPVIIGPNKSVLTSLGSKLIIPCKAFFGLGSRSTALLWWTANNTFLRYVYEEGRVKQGQLNEYSEKDRIYMEVSLIFNSVEEKDLNTEFICTAQNRLGHQTLQVRVKEESTFSWGIAVAPLSLIFLVFVGIWMHLRWKQKSGKVYTTRKSKIIARDCQSSTPYRKEMI